MQINIDMLQGDIYRVNSTTVLAGVIVFFTVNFGAVWKKFDQLDFSLEVLLAWRTFCTSLREVPLSKALNLQLSLPIVSNANTQNKEMLPISQT